MASGITWSRPEAFGAWLRLGDDTLVAVDASLAIELGVDPANAPAIPRPLELHLGVTSRCAAGCVGCYVDALPDGHEPSFEALCARLDRAREAQVSTVAFGGGEPLSRRDLGDLAAHARGLGLVPVMTTSGIGLTEARARALTAFAQVNVSHDGVGDAYASVRGFDGAAIAERAIALLVAAGIPVGVNFVLTRASFDAMRPTAERAADLGAIEVQLLRYKPAGRAIGPDYLVRRLAPAQIDALWPAIAALVAAQRIAVRIDCAMVPLLSSALVASVESPADTLARLGVFGCEAGRHLGSQRSDGRVAPCSFSPASDADPGPSTIDAWERDAELARFRAYHAAPPEPCASCELFAVCRGGCQVVSRHVAGAMRPDPECPRVRAHEAGARA